MEDEELDPSTELSTLTVKELRAHLQQQGLSVRGNKPQLIARLARYLQEGEQTGSTQQGTRRILEKKDEKEGKLKKKPKLKEITEGDAFIIVCRPRRVVCHAKIAHR